jgi:hypothetical protein
MRTCLRRKYIYQFDTYGRLVGIPHLHVFFIKARRLYMYSVTEVMLVPALLPPTSRAGIVLEKRILRFMTFARVPVGLPPPR